MKQNSFKHAESLPDFLCADSTGNSFTPAPQQSTKNDIFKQKQLHFKHVSVVYWKRWKLLPLAVSTLILYLVCHWASPQSTTLLHNMVMFPRIIWTTHKVIRFTVFSGILISMPLLSFKSSEFIQHTFSALVLLTTAVQLELLFERNQCLIVFVVFMIIFRLFENRTVFDCAALCLAYTSDIGAINRKALTWYISSMIFLWTYFLIGCALAHMYRRISYRIWEHIRILIILREKTKLEKLMGDFIVKGHVSQELRNHLFPSVGDARTSSISDTAAVTHRTITNLFSQSGLTAAMSTSGLMTAQSSFSSIQSLSGPAFKPRRIYSNKAFLKPVVVVKRQTSSQSQSLPTLLSSKRYSSDNDHRIKLSTSASSATTKSTQHVEKSLYGQMQSEMNISDDVLRMANKLDIVSHFTNSLISIEQLNTTGGLDRRHTVLVAIRPDYSATWRDCVLNTTRDSDFFVVVDCLARAHKVARVRAFGNTWIGCLGCLTETWETDATNVYHAVIFACEVASIAKQYFRKVFYAVEYGDILCGFQGNNPGFDFFGQEIRWLLMAVELREFGTIALGESARSQLNVFRRHVTELLKSIANQKLDSTTQATTASIEADGRMNELTNVKIPDLEHRTVDRPGTTSSKMTVYCVVNVNAMVDHEYVKVRLGQHFATWSAMQTDSTSHNERTLHSLLHSASDSQKVQLPGVSWYTVQKILERDEIEVDFDITTNALTSHQGRRNWKVFTAPEYGSLDLRLDASGRLCKEEVNLNTKQKTQRLSTVDLHSRAVGIEFQTSVLERYGIQLNDPVLDSMTATQLAEAHVEVEREIYNVVYYICFPNPMHSVFITNVYNGVTGRKEYPFIEKDSLASQVYAMVNAVLKNIWDVFNQDFQSTNDYSVPPDGDIEMQADPRQRSDSNSSFAAADSALKRRNKRTKQRLSLYNKIKAWYLQRLERVHPVDYSINSDDEYEGGDRYISPDGGMDDSSRRSRADDSCIDDANDDDGDNGNGSETYIYSVLRTRLKSLLDKIIPQAVLLLGVDNIRESRTTDEDGKELPFARSWFKYSVDSRLYLQSNCWLNGVIDTCLMLVTWYSLVPAYNPTRETSLPKYLFLLLYCCIIHLFLCVVVNKRFETQIHIVQVIVRCIFMYFLPGSVLCFNTAVAGDMRNSAFGDLGGDVTIMLVVTFRMASLLRQNVWLAFVDSMTVRVMLMPFWKYSNCLATSSARLMSLFLNVLLFGLCVIIGHRTFVSYIVEHKLVPFACQSYQRQKKNSRKILKKFVPSVSPQPSSAQLYIQNPYRLAAIATLHLKAPDILSGFIDAKELDAVLKQIYSMLDAKIEECGFLKVTQFSGITLAVACKEGLSEDYSAKAVVLMHRIQQLIERFSKEFSFNVPIGVAVNHGSVNLGFIGNVRHVFDIHGIARDASYAMACNKSEGIYASDYFEEDIRRGHPVNDSPRHKKDKMNITHITTTTTSTGNKGAELRRHPENIRRDVWLRIDGVLSGMQLDDFEYLNMLGRGGYGSVHLVRETNTKVQYAIKVVVLKTGSVLSKMITRECIILQMMQHPNVLNLKFAFTKNSRMYMVMTYVEGGNLKQVLERDKLELKHLTLWFAEIVLALEYVHSIGIIHRDLKPANCMIGTDGHLRLADFGLSKIITSPSNVLMGMSSNVSLGSKDSLNQFYRKYEEDNPMSESLGLSREAYRKIQKFLPLKLTLAKSKVQPKHRLFRIVSVRATIKNNLSLRFDTLTIDMLLARSVDDAVRIIHNNKNVVDCIFIDIDPKSYDIPGTWDPERDGVVLLKKLCADCFNSLPVCITSTTLPIAKIKKKFVVAGARDVFDVALSNCDEKLFRRLFMIPDEPAIDVTVPDNLIPGSANNSMTAVSPEPSVTNNVNSKSKRDASASNQGSQHSAVGTLHFIAPEVLRTSHYSKPVDWWALGITIYECIVGSHVFPGEDKEDVSKQITFDGPVDLSLLQPYGDTVFNLTSGLLTKDVQKRLGTSGTEKIKMHPFFAAIDWDNVSECTPEYIPAAFPPKRYDVQDRLLFYGEPEKTDTKQLYASTNMSINKHAADSRTTGNGLHTFKHHNSGGNGFMGGRPSRYGLMDFSTEVLHEIEEAVEIDQEQDESSPPLALQSNALNDVLSPTQSLSPMDSLKSYPTSTKQSATNETYFQQNVVSTSPQRVTSQRITNTVQSQISNNKNYTQQEGEESKSDEVEHTGRGVIGLAGKLLGQIKSHDTIYHYDKPYDHESEEGEDTRE